MRAAHFAAAFRPPQPTIPSVEFDLADELFAGAIEKSNETSLEKHKCAHGGHHHHCAHAIEAPLELLEKHKCANGGHHGHCAH